MKMSESGEEWIIFTMVTGAEPVPGQAVPRRKRALSSGMVARTAKD
jgi:hypothetical protein